MNVGTLVGKYRILREIGGGGMAQVYEAQDQTIGRKVALKVLAVPPAVPEPEKRLLIERSGRSVHHHRLRPTRAGRPAGAGIQADSLALFRLINRDAFAQNVLFQCAFGKRIHTHEVDAVNDG